MTKYATLAMLFHDSCSQLPSGSLREQVAGFAPQSHSLYSLTYTQSREVTLTAEELFLGFVTTGHS